MRYLSVCSGIEAATVAWHPLGWTPVAFSEIEAFPSAVLRHHYPDGPNLGDMTRYRDWELDRGSVDLIVGGTPCQSFSVAGLRKGLADPRGNLALVFLGLVDHLRPEWVVWENVPGVLSSDGGRDFGAFLGALGQLGYGWAYRVLDAQFFGVAQRRRRVFVVASARGWQRAAAVLFERQSLCGDSPPRREAGQRAPTIPSRSSAGGGLGTDFDCDGGLIHVPPIVPQAMSSKWSKGSSGPAGDEVANLVAHSLRADGFDASEDGTGRGTPLVPVAVAFDTTQITSKANRSNPRAGDPCHPLAAGAHPPAIAFKKSQSGTRVGDVHATLDANKGSRRVEGVMYPVAPALTAYNMDSRSPQSEEQQRIVGAVHAASMAVRRLTPRECERLQGFPDDYTLIPKLALTALGIEPDPANPKHWAADGPRYKALGNSMAVPCMAWIGQRIALVEAAENHKNLRDAAAYVKGREDEFAEIADGRNR